MTRMAETSKQKTIIKAKISRSLIVHLYHKHKSADLKFFAEIVTFSNLKYKEGGLRIFSLTFWKVLEYFRKYILRQFLKCQKIFKGNTLRIFSRKCYNLRENILWILFDILKIVLLRFWVTGSEQLSGYQPAQNQALLWSFK